jgi:hypothetical protein
MADREGYPSYEDEMMSNRRLLMDTLAGQEEASLDGQLDGIITAQDLDVARIAFDGDYLINDTELGDK